MHVTRTPLAAALEARVNSQAIWKFGLGDYLLKLATISWQTAGSQKIMEVYEIASKQRIGFQP